MNKNHFLSILFATIVVILVLYVSQMYSSLNLPNFVYAVIVILGAMSFLFGEWISKAINERPALYVNRYMIGFMVKMFSFLSLLVVYLYLYPENKTQIAISLFVCYLIFNVHMIVFLKKHEKIHMVKNNPSKKSN